MQSLAALNRMNSLIVKSGTLPVLVKLLEEGNLDRQLITSCIRSSGPIGENLLIKVFLFYNHFFFYHLIIHNKFVTIIHLLKKK